MTVKQLDFACCQVVQKPFALSFHVPLFFWPDSASGSRVILPSGVNVILNLVPPGVEAVKGSPLKKVAWMSLGAIGSAAKAALDSQWFCIALPNHSITSSARASSVGGTSTPSALAVRHGGPNALERPQAKRRLAVRQCAPAV